MEFGCGGHFAPGIVVRLDVPEEGGYESSCLCHHLQQGRNQHPVSGLVFSLSTRETPRQVRFSRRHFVSITFLFISPCMSMSILHIVFRMVEFNDFFPSKYYCVRQSTYVTLSTDIRELKLLIQKDEWALWNMDCVL